MQKLTPTVIVLARLAGVFVGLAQVFTRAAAKRTPGVDPKSLHVVALTTRQAQDVLEAGIRRNLEAMSVAARSVAANKGAN